MSDAAYASNWYKFSCPTLRKHITILINKTQNPRPFTAAGFVPCNLVGLVSVTTLVCLFVVVYLKTFVVGHQKIFFSYNTATNTRGKVGAYWFLSKIFDNSV